MKASSEALVRHVLDIRARDARPDLHEKMGRLLLGWEDHRALLREWLDSWEYKDTTGYPNQYAGVEILCTPTPGVRYMLAYYMPGSASPSERHQAGEITQLLTHAISAVEGETGAKGDELAFLMGPRQQFLNRDALKIGVDYDRPYAYYANVPVYAVNREGLWAVRMPSAWVIDSRSQE